MVIDYNGSYKEGLVQGNFIETIVDMEELKFPLNKYIYMFRNGSDGENIDSIVINDIQYSVVENVTPEKVFSELYGNSLGTNIVYIFKDSVKSVTLCDSTLPHETIPYYYNILIVDLEKVNHLVVGNVEHMSPIVKHIDDNTFYDESVFVIYKKSNYYFIVKDE